MTTDAAPSTSRLVLIPSYNTGPLLLETVNSALRFWKPVWVVIDGSTDGSDRALAPVQEEHDSLRILRLPINRGKGAAVLEGMRRALEAGYSHALVMDSDGQHPATEITKFMALSHEHPGCMILGEPQFQASAPLSRRYGRRVGNWWARFETLWSGVRDSLFGFRVYPIQPSVMVLESIRGGRRYDFDTQLAVRLHWRGVGTINIPVPVRYLSAAEGGVSHFRYLKDNAVLFGAHVGLVLGMLPRIPWLLQRRERT